MVGGNQSYSTFAWTESFASDLVMTQIFDKSIHCVIFWSLNSGNYTYHPLQHKATQLCVLYAHSIYAFHRNLAINTAYFAKQH
jgi:hypothetical protein